jgi:hypothetical protein
VTQGEQAAADRAVATFSTAQFVIDVTTAFGVLDINRARAHCKRLGLSSLPPVSARLAAHWRLDVLLSWMYANNLKSLPNFAGLAERRGGRPSGPFERRAR